MTGDDKKAATNDGSRIRVRRFDADRHDEVLDLDAALTSTPSERQLLWIDITGPMPDGLARRLTDAEVADVVALLRPHRQLLIEHGRKKASEGRTA